MIVNSADTSLFREKSADFIGRLHFNVVLIKGIVHPNMKIPSLITHPVILNP